MAHNCIFANAEFETLFLKMSVVYRVRVLYINVGMAYIAYIYTATMTLTRSKTANVLKVFQVVAKEIQDFIHKYDGMNSDWGAIYEITMTNGDTCSLGVNRTQAGFILWGSTLGYNTVMSEMQDTNYGRELISDKIFMWDTWIVGTGHDVEDRVPTDEESDIIRGYLESKVDVPINATLTWSVDEKWCDEHVNMAFVDGQLASYVPGGVNAVTVIRD